MARALQMYLGSDLTLQRTPRILTIAGDLDKRVDALPGNLVSTDITMDNIMEEPDGDLDKLFDVHADMEEAVRKISADIQHQGVGVKLMGFQVNGNDEKDKNTSQPSFYSLVKPIKPLTVGGSLKREGRGTVLNLNIH